MAGFRRSRKNRQKVRPGSKRNGPNLRRRRTASNRQKRIWFERLPDLVKCKILRQYVPVLDKIRTLPALPEFSRTLHIRWSWMNASDAFADVASELRALQDGFYVTPKDLPDHGYHVSSGTSGKTITFTLFCMTDITHTWEVHHWSSFVVTAPASNLRDFLSVFQKNYLPIEDTPVLVYTVNAVLDIFVNRPAKVATWRTNVLESVLPPDIRPIEGDRCHYGKWKYGPPSWSFCLKHDDNMILENKRAIQKIKPTPLKAHVLMKCILSGNLPQRDCWKEGPIPAEKKLCRFEFTLEGKENISLCVTTPYPRPCLYLVEQHEHKTWLETFSAGILKNIRDSEKDFFDFIKTFDEA